MLEHPPRRFEFGAVGEDFTEGFDAVVVEVVVSGQLEIPRAEDLRFERRSGTVVADALDAGRTARCVVPG